MENPKSSLPKIINLYKEKKFKEVINICDQLVGDQEINDAKVLNIQACSLHRLGEHAKAEQIFLNALLQNPQDKHLLINLATLYIEESKISEAQTIYSALRHKYPEDQTIITEAKKVEYLYNQFNKEQTNKQGQSIAQKVSNPLLASFDTLEVDKSKANLEERRKIIQKKKLKKHPDFPPLDASLLAEEWAMAAEDAFNAGFPDFCLNLCGISAKYAGGGSEKLYTIAANAYLQLKQYNNAHLCLLIAHEFGDLDSAQQINLLSLACTLGDHNLLNSRLERCRDAFKLSTHLTEQMDQISKQISDGDELQFLSNAGPCRKINNQKQYNTK
jgi:TolA-binding protein